MPTRHGPPAKASRPRPAQLPMEWGSLLPLSHPQPAAGARHLAIPVVISASTLQLQHFSSSLMQRSISLMVMAGLAAACAPDARVINQPRRPPLVAAAQVGPLLPPSRPPIQHPRPVPNASAQQPTPAPSAPPHAPATPVRAPRFGQADPGGIRIDFVAFDTRSHQLAVADQVGGPGTRWADAASAGRAAGALAAINAGFFTPTGAPLGLVVTRGERRGSLNRSTSLGSGMFLSDPTHGPRILRRELFSNSLQPTELLQAGPFLVDRGQAVAGLGQAVAARSIIATDGAHQWLIARTSPCSLAALAKALATSQPGGFPVHSALNLDGGSSADLWVSQAIPGGPATIRPIWNKPVRNFLVLTKRG